MSPGQWLRSSYDVKTLADLVQDEIFHGPFAQIIRYEGKPRNRSLGSATYDFYKICVQDHSILSVLAQSDNLIMYPFTLYIICHELVHIVRFKRFLQNFVASPEETMIEEKRVHEITHRILEPVRIPGISHVFGFYQNWRIPMEDLRNTGYDNTSI
jgi:hypothetical protein